MITTNTAAYHCFCITMTLFKHIGGRSGWVELLSHLKSSREFAAMYTQLCSVQNNEKELLGPSMGYVQRHNEWRIILILSCPSSSTVYPPWSLTDLMSDCTDWNGLWSWKSIWRLSNQNQNWFIKAFKTVWRCLWIVSKVLLKSALVSMGQYQSAFVKLEHHPPCEGYFGRKRRGGDNWALAYFVVTMFLSSIQDGSDQHYWDPNCFWSFVPKSLWWL